MFKPEKLNLTYFFCKWILLLVVILCLTDVQSWSIVAKEQVWVVDFSLRIKRKTLEQMQHVVVNFKFKKKLSMRLLITCCYFTRVLISFFGRSPLMVLFFILQLLVSTVIYILELFYICIILWLVIIRETEHVFLFFFFRKFVKIRFLSILNPHSSKVLRSVKKFTSVLSSQILFPSLCLHTKTRSFSYCFLLFVGNQSSYSNCSYNQAYWLLEWTIE